MRTRQTLTLLFSIFLAVPTSAQITIGSSIPPSQGTLLDLKENKTYPKSATSSKGLGLPRVNLTKTNPQTDKELAESIGNADEEYDRGSHIGLVVYNSNSEGCTTDRDTYPPLPGVYVWTGEEWQLLANTTDDVRSISYLPESIGANGITVGTFSMTYNNGTDPAESENYDYAYFGNAGAWMTQNLRTKYSPNGTKLAMTGKQSSDGKDINGKPQKAGAYPHSTDPTLSNYYEDNKASGFDVGLLYDWYTAVDHRNCSWADQDQKGFLEDAPGSQEVESKENKSYIKGICPTGWHLPSDREWTQLEKEITEHVDNYGKSTYNISDKTWDNSWESINTAWRSLLTGATMKSPQNLLYNTCNSGGESQDSKMGGFNALLVGDAEEGRNYNYSLGTSFWTSSSFSNPYNTVALARNLNYSRKEYYRGAFNRKTFYSIRCKKD